MRSVSKKRQAQLDSEGLKLYGSTIARKPKKFAPAVLAEVNRFAASSPKRSSPMPKARKPIAKRNPERAAKRDKAYAAGLRAYHASETKKLVEVRSAGRCEFSIADDRSCLPRVLDVRVDRERPAGYSRCGRKAKPHHHTTYARFGGRELPEDMLHGCTKCHEYVEALKPVSRASARAGGG